MRNSLIQKLNQLDEDEKYDFIREMEYEETDEKCNFLTPFCIFVY